MLAFCWLTAVALEIGSFGWIFPKVTQTLEKSIEIKVLNGYDAKVVSGTPLSYFDDSYYILIGGQYTW
jgi:hypothetical protein